jgi:hypothetical protein
MPLARLSSRPSAGLKIAATLLLVAGLAFFVGAARAYRSGPLAGVPRDAARAATAAQSKRAGRQVEAELVTLRPNGFEPSEVTRPAGEFILMVENRGGRAADLRLYAETGGRLREVRSSEEEPDWNDLLDLHPGRYTLTDAARPESVCHITITAR